MINRLAIDNIIKNALLEDIPYEDITTDSVIFQDSTSKADLICKEDGIICGLNVFKRVFEILGNVDVNLFKEDGDYIKESEIVAKVKGNTRNILKGERTALNILQRMSGIATLTHKFAEKIKDTDAKILDTRKTTPNLRVLEKYAVLKGGGHNHRYNLSDGILLKDNHISAAGGVKEAISLARKNSSFVRKIEVETENLNMVKEALECKADIIMLDNMDIEEAKKAVLLINKRALTEFSGNVSLENVREAAQTGVNYISVGALTHSVKSLDLSLKNLHNC
ncbi:carboxylating nicotinate-nucleotide diphosphorylase [Clostridium sp. BJN0001]|uniref:carboxylating nicotinate-nucleotide diphosphorylase n=1 Tax=Clostridium sp. BJN0001 TaxID=2930219 RepID=UPI001FD5C7A6|nr:carboxylating nicotinate-nucleotide diphosphorylase [Clostridium sp. BJN0001]